MTLNQKHRHPRVAVADKLFRVLLRRFWPGWKQALIFVQPETVVRWHRAGFKLYWEWLSRHRTRAGRKCISIELRELIFRMVAENPTWGALSELEISRIPHLDLDFSNEFAFDSLPMERRKFRCRDNPLFQKIEKQISSLCFAPVEMTLPL
jgi:hypothetical protein